MLLSVCVYDKFNIITGLFTEYSSIISFKITSHPTDHEANRQVINFRGWRANPAHPRIFHIIYNNLILYNLVA